MMTETVLREVIVMEFLQFAKTARRAPLKPLRAPRRFSLAASTERK